jgi:hypothetical protein
MFLQVRKTNIFHPVSAAAVAAAAVAAAAAAAAVLGYWLSKFHIFTVDAHEGWNI